MKKWSEYTGQEKRMVIVIAVLLIVVLLSWGRVRNDFRKGVEVFFGIPRDTVQVIP